MQKDLDYLAGLKTLDDVAHAMGSVRLSTVSIYNIGVGVDDKNPDNYSVNLGQGGLGMPDRDYYLSSDEAIVKTRDAYRKYLADMMTLAGMSDVEARADRMLALETEIAKVSWTRADRRDDDKIYNPMPVSALKTLAPDFAWDAFLSRRRHPAEAAGRQRALCHRGGEDRLRSPGHHLQDHAGLDLARLPDGALPAQLSRPICPSGSTIWTSPSMAPC